MQHDKKVSNGQLRFVLIKGIGEAYLTADVEKKQVFGVLEKSLSGDL
jgi:3-dehydroquinate synthase